MAGLIVQEDIERVRTLVNIEQIVSDHVTLRPAGVGSLKGLCPFHDERTPSFHVRVDHGFYHCFGCGESGDAITFVRNIYHLSFAEALEYLADKVGVQLRYEQARGGGSAQRRDGNQRLRLIEAHRVAQEFYARYLTTPAAAPGREFLKSRGFGPADAARYGIGYAPAGWDSLTKHLRDRGFTEPELQASGLVSRGSRGIYDRFRDRLMWPIRDLTETTVGFGARLMNGEGPKYLNSPETDIFKKSQLLYGLDLAKKEVAASRRIVIVEGYTDVMAAHKAGIGTAVATCGTAFGADHVRVVRRLLGDSADPAAGVMLSSGRTRGAQVIFTFDGDEAGQKAALKAFNEDQSFAAQTFVAVAASGLDPCDLRLQGGDEALRQLIDSKIPLFEFVLKSILRGQDLNTAEGRVTALHATAPIISQIRDRALRREYGRELAGWLGMNEDDVNHELAAAARKPAPQPTQHQPAPHQPAAQATQQYGAAPHSHGPGAGPAGNAATMLAGQGPNHSPNQALNHSPNQGPGYGPGQSGGVAAGPAVPPRQLRLPPVGGPEDRIERDALAAFIQYPQLVDAALVAPLRETSFTISAHRAVWRSISAGGGLARYQELAATATPAQAYSQWLDGIRAAAPPQMRDVFTELAVWPLPFDEQTEAATYVRGVITTLVRHGLRHENLALQSELARTPAGSERYSEIFTQLMANEGLRQRLEQG